MALFSSGTRQVKLLLVGDSKQLERTLGRTETRLQKFGKRVDAAGMGSRSGGLSGLAGLAKGGGIALGAGLAAQQTMKFAQAESDLNEQITKSQAVFGKSSDELQQWSMTTAGSIGVSRTAALEATGTFGNLFDTVGVGSQKSAAMSKTLVTLASDLASFNNAAPEDALDALRSGLIGEAEPLRRFGVLLSETRVQQQAMSDTGKKTAASLTQQEKALARYEIIMHDTNKAQGDFERTSGSLANQQRVLKARLADTRAELGTQLLPAMVKVTEYANRLVASFHGVEATVQHLFSQDFRQMYADAFGIDKLNEVLTRLGPQIQQAMKDFAKSIQPFDLTLQTGGGSGDPKAIPSFGQPGFKPGKQGIPATKVSNRLVTQELDARMSGNKSVLKGILAKEAQFLRDALRDPRITIGQEVGLKQALLGVTDEIAAMDDEMIQSAKDKAAAAKSAKEKLREANRRAVEAFKDQANAIKSAVLNAFDTKQSKISNARALEDAQAVLKQARMLGGPETIKLALRDVNDAKAAIQRQQIEQMAFRVTEGPKGPVNTLAAGNITFNIYGATDPDKIAKQVIAAINRSKKQTAGQPRGRNPGSVY